MPPKTLARPLQLEALADSAQGRLIRTKDPALHALERRVATGAYIALEQRAPLVTLKFPVDFCRCLLPRFPRGQSQESSRPGREARQVIDRKCRLRRRGHRCIRMSVPAGSSYAHATARVTGYKAPGKFQPWSQPVRAHVQGFHFESASRLTDAAAVPPGEGLRPN